MIAAVGWTFMSTIALSNTEPVDMVAPRQLLLRCSTSCIPAVVSYPCARDIPYVLYINVHLTESPFEFY
jgi:hypothetical protein